MKEQEIIWLMLVVQLVWIVLKMAGLFTLSWIGILLPIITFAAAMLILLMILGLIEFNKE